ncbi:reverse transcriptase domain-containing protein [Tanacetum coccineum]
MCILHLSRTLHETEKNYAPLEKLALCLLHLSQRLRRYFEAHPIQPIKQILNKPEASGKLAKYAVELWAYNITYMPLNAVKGQVLTDFLNEVPVGTRHLEVCSLADDKKLKEWTLFTNGASSLKGAGAGLVLNDSARAEYTYAIRINFASTNNEVEYEALLAGLRIAGKIKPYLREQAVILNEIGMPTYRTIQWNEAQNEEEMRLNLDLIQERREITAIWEAKYKKKEEQYYNK